MEQIAIRQLNQDTAEVMARVQAGETVEITNRGRPVGWIVPIHHDELDDLVAEGRVTPATGRGPWVVPTGPVDETRAASAVLLEMRDEERG